MSGTIPQGPIVILGGGSIGERHVRILWRLGCRELIVYRRRDAPFRDLGGAEVRVVTDWDAVLAGKPFAAIICSPTSHHLDQTRMCIEAGMHVLAEKPLSPGRFDAAELIALARRHDRLVQVGYMLRYHPLLLEAKALIDGKVFGNLIAMQTYWGEYLPAWHPWEDYRDSYAARKELGGGPALTLSHDVDVCLWLAGAPLESWQPMRNHASRLEVTTESAFDLNMAFANGVTAHAHMNFCQPVGQRFYKLVFDEAVIDIDYFAAAMTIATADASERRVAEGFDRDEMFLAQDKDFLDRIASGQWTEATRAQIELSSQIMALCDGE